MTRFDYLHKHKNRHTAVDYPQRTPTYNNNNNGITAGRCEQSQRQIQHGGKKMTELGGADTVARSHHKIPVGSPPTNRQFGLVLWTELHTSFVRSNYYPNTGRL